MPIFHDVSQGSVEWYILRLGIPTASEFSKIITPKKLELSDQAHEYANAKIAEILTGETQGIDRPTYEMERGKILEVEAREAYEFANNVTVHRGGFTTDDEGKHGCSVDFRVDKNGGGEIKCLLPKNHVKYLVQQEVDPKNLPQVYGQIWIEEWEWCDWYMYHPDLPRVSIRTYRNEAYIKALAAAMTEFHDIMGNKIETLKERGHFQPRIPSVLADAFGGRIVPAGETIISAG